MYEELSGRTAVVTGGGGAICGEIAGALAAFGVRVAIWDLCEEAARRKADDIRRAGGTAKAVRCDVTDADSVQAALNEVLAEWTRLDFLVNGAGGNRSDATTSPEQTFFDLDPHAVMGALKLNFLSALIPSQALGRHFAQQGSGAIVNISSITGIRPVTRAVGYSAGKAATNSFTQWLAVHMCEEYSPAIRVNAVAPGFILTAQNRFLLLDEKTGQTTERGMKILSAVPMRRYGQPSEVTGAVLWLLSDSASFVTGAVIPVDGGFTASSGV